MKLIIILSLVFASPAFADQTTEVKYGDAVKYDGILLDKEAANKVFRGLNERDLFEKIIDSQTKSINLLKANEDYSEKKVSTLLDQNDKLAESLRSSQSMNSWERIGIFVLGIAATVGAGFAIRAATK